jgi:NTE family protein
MYVDGGVVSPVPVDAARQQGGDVVIAVDIASPLEGPKPEGILEILLQSIDIMYSRLASVQCAKADVVIRPRVGHIASSDFSRRHEAIMEGEKAAAAALPRIREILEKLKKEGRLQ